MPVVLLSLSGSMPRWLLLLAVSVWACLLWRSYVLCNYSRAQLIICESGSIPFPCIWKYLRFYLLVALFIKPRQP